MVTQRNQVATFFRSRASAVRRTLRYQRFIRGCSVIAILFVTGVTWGDPPPDPMLRIRNGEIVRMVATPYTDETGRQRTLYIVREKLTWNRLPTTEEFNKLVAKNDANPRWNLHSTFQRDDGNVIFWVLDGNPDDKLELARPLGVVYSFPGDDHFAADVIWHPGREEFLMVLSKTLRGRITIAIFPLDLQAKFGAKPFAVLDLPEDKWPKPLAPIAELRAELFQHICDTNLLRVVPEERFADNAFEQNLLITAATSRVNCKPPLLFRYQLRKREWSYQKLSEQEGQIVENWDKDSEYLQKHHIDLNPPAEKGDPGGPRRPKPLKPVPDPEASKSAPLNPK